MSTIQNITTVEFQDEVIRSEIPVLVDFYADWCGPCRMLAPVLEGLAREMAGRVKIVKVNVDDEPELAQYFRVQSIPTLLAFRDGQVVDKLIGIGSPGELRRALERLAGAAPQVNQRVRAR